MGYTDVDQLAINTIRVLAVSTFSRHEHWPCCDTYGILALSTIGW